VIQNAVVRVPVASMDTAHSKRDKKMYRMFDSDNYPLIKGYLADFEPQFVLRQLRDKGDEPAHLSFQLRIRNVTRPVEASISELQESQQRISFVAEFPVSLSDFQLKAPSVLGLIRVADNVRVVVNVVLYPDRGFKESP
jgi:polyisoprenoid-binding protein YceI